MADIATQLRQLLATGIIRFIQRYGPHSVIVRGRTYEISKVVFNPKYYLTSEFMAQHICVRPEDEVLDMGTGSGIQAITAGQTAHQVVAVDINPHAVLCARENVTRNNLQSRISVLEGDLFSPLSPGSRFDVILFTPPYLEGRVRSPLDHALRDPRKSLARRFLQDARRYLKRDGYVQLVYSSIAELDRVLEIACALGWGCRLVAEKKVLFETLVIYRLSPTRD